jgi:hypothetical protein
MSPRKITALAATAAIALGSAGAAQARHGADDPAGHVRHGGGADDAQPHAKRVAHKRHKHHRHAHLARHGRGNDDGPNHT